MILAPLAAAALVVSVATAPNADPRAFPTLSAHQRSAAMESLMRSATECIARSVSVDPRFKERNPDLGDLIVDSMSHCVVQVRHDRRFMGPYLDVLPSAVSKWVRDAVKYPPRTRVKEKWPPTGGQFHVGGAMGACSIAPPLGPRHPHAVAPCLEAQPGETMRRQRGCGASAGLSTS